MPWVARRARGGEEGRTQRQAERESERGSDGWVGEVDSLTWLIVYSKT